jgi:two-component system sensor histidine kinase KdpD
MGNLSSSFHLLIDRIDRTVYPQRMSKRLVFQRVMNPWYRYLAVVALVVLATALDTPLHTHIAPTNLAMIYLVAVVISAAYLGRGPAILASILGVLSFDYFFVPPFLTLRVLEPEYLITFAGLLGVGLIISELTVRAREQAEAAGQREKETAAMYALSRDLATIEDTQHVIQALTMHIQQVFESEVRLVYTEKGLLPQSLSAWQIPLRSSQGNLGILDVKPRGLQASAGCWRRLPARLLRRSNASGYPSAPDRCR